MEIKDKQISHLLGGQYLRVSPRAGSREVVHSSRRGASTLLLE
jgi:hypothetical protein